jgi:hypothetical protein
MQEKELLPHLVCYLNRVLELRLIRHIGNGTSTNIWSDKWIPNVIGLKSVSRPKGATTTKVSELLSQAGSWDEDALEVNLVPMNATTLSFIPLGRITDAFWAWTGEKHSNYSIKSAYRLLMAKANQEEEHVHGKPSHSDAHNNWVWKKLWQCKVPLKVRVFWWRVSNEFIPSRANLHHRHVEPMDTCVTCGAQPETTYHAMISCMYASQFWRSLAELTGVKILELHQITWTTDVLDNRICRERDRSIILCGMWSLWNSRNDRKHDNSPISMKLALIGPWMPISS